MKEKKFKLSDGVERVIDVLGEVLAFFTVMLWVFMLLQYTFGFLGDELAGTLDYIKEWATLLVLGMKGLEFATKRGFIVFLFYAVLIATCVVFMFFPEVWTTIIGAGA